MQNAEDGDGDGGFDVFNLTIRVKVVGTLYIARQLLLCTEVQPSVEKYSGQFCSTVRLPPSPTSHPPSPHSAYLRYLLCSSLTTPLPAERLRELFQLAHKKNNLSEVV